MKTIDKIKRRLDPAVLSGEIMSRLHVRKGDCREMETLYRQFVLPDLPEREERAEDLFNLWGTTVGEGLYIVDRLHKSLSAGGDICEFGVAQGSTSRLIAQEIRPTDRKLWLFDSFEGLPKPHLEKDQLIDDIFNLGDMQAYHGTMCCQKEEVLDQLKKIDFTPDRYVVRQGWVDKTLAEGPVPDAVCFAYLDFDFYEPTLVGLNFLHNRMASGATVVLDDYDFFSSGVKTAVEEFTAQHPGQYKLELPVSAAGHFAILTKTA